MPNSVAIVLIKGKKRNEFYSHSRDTLSGKQIMLLTPYKIFTFLGGPDLSLCCCVCSEWNMLISQSKKLANKKNSLDPYEPIKQKYTFSADSGYREIFGVCSLLDRIIVSGGQERVQIFDQKGNPMSTLAMRQSFKPIGICIRQNNLLITDVWNKMIHVFNENYHFRGSIPTREFKPKEICSTPDGLLIVSTHSSEILILDGNGQIVQVFGSQGHREDQFDCPGGIACNSRDEILIADCGNYRIQVFSRNGKFLYNFGSKGSDPYQFGWPYGICVDQNDNIFIADRRNDRVSIFNSSLKHIHSIPILEPNSLCLMQGRRLVVTTISGIVWVFGN